jgi:hypothetical protein
MDLKWFCELFKIPCICDSMSMMTGNSSGGDNTDCLFFGVDRLMNSSMVLEALSASTRMLIRYILYMSYIYIHVYIYIYMHIYVYVIYISMVCRRLSQPLQGCLSGAYILNSYLCFWLVCIFV